MVCISVCVCLLLYFRVVCVCIFFFSSRRRHTRCSRDWSSDVCSSDLVADDLAQYRRWQPHLYDLGECEVKHGVRVFLVNLYTDELGNSAMPAKFKKFTEQTQPATIPATVADAKAKRIPWGAIAAVSLVIAALLAGFL